MAETECDPLNYFKILSINNNSNGDQKFKK